jgi:hypothetical protein
MKSFWSSWALLQSDLICARQGMVLGFGISRNRSLKRLSVRGCQLGPRAAFTLALALRSNRTLGLLDISHNPVGVAGGGELLGLVLDHGHRLKILTE